MRRVAEKFENRLLGPTKTALSFQPSAKTGPSQNAPETSLVGSCFALSTSPLKAEG
jgi:hypothetical protein